jgi:hypothetical protein
MSRDSFSMSLYIGYFGSVSKALIKKTTINATCIELIIKTSEVVLE